MKNKINRKYLYDALMTIIIILLMDYSVTGLALHEWLGLAVFILFAVHNIINYKWIKNVTLSFFGKKIKPRVKLMYVLDATLLIFLLAVTASGILLSENIFSFELHNRLFWVKIHDISAYGIFIAISAHIGLHWKNITAAVKKGAHIRRPNIIRTIFIRLITLILILAGIKSSFDNHIGEKLLPFDIGAKENADDTPLLNSQNSGASKTQSALTQETSTETVPTLSEYLGSLHCTFCSKHCPLSAPQCSKGKVAAQQAESTYYSIYSQKNDSAPVSGLGTDGGTDNAAESSGGTLNQPEPADISNLFADYLPVMGLYIASTYYLIEWTGKKSR